ncbi:hypothetical protein [Planktothrix agardhii]|uniref:hypothetical protein n=1 Tax=Planktothrix agardhii TaxID=1160 RepID=UPI001F2BFE9F|nr:hypothetical protein [Planktothrix agardhii]MCF3613741.1 hypothetical protein [Planktothrix agardhii 1027]
MAQSLLKLPNFPKEQSVEVIIILEDNSQTWSAETLAMERLPQLENPSQLITIIEANSEIDEDELKQWVNNRHLRKFQIKRSTITI